MSVTVLVFENWMPLLLTNKHQFAKIAYTATAQLYLPKVYEEQISLWKSVVSIFCMRKATRNLLFIYRNYLSRYWIEKVIWHYKCMISYTKLFRKKKNPKRILWWSKKNKCLDQMQNVLNHCRFQKGPRDISCVNTKYFHSIKSSGHWMC